MAGNCFPCWLKHKPTADLQEKPAKSLTLQCPSQDNDLGPPTTGEMATDAITGILAVLEAVSCEIPFPGVATAVKAASALIQACGDADTTLRKAGKLKNRVRALLLVMAHELHGKKDITEELKEDIKQLEKDLADIKSALKNISAQHRLLLIFFKSANEGRLAECLERLDGALGHFHFARQLDDSNILQKLEKEISAYHKKMQQSVDAIRQDVACLLQKFEDVHPSKPVVSSSRRIPPKPQIFHGRGPLVDDLAHKLTAVSEDEKSAHIAILAAGGMGKTSVALAVMEHEKVVAKFRKENCYWVPCVEMTSPSLLLDTLYSHLQVQRVTERSLDDILNKLYNLSDPVVLLLDNFETPWASDAKGAENILCAIASIPKVAILLTMRSSDPPSDDNIVWHPVPLTSVDPAYSRQIYEEIWPNSRKDPDLSKLLEQLGHLPLAVTLMAKLAKKTKSKARKLLKDWDRIGPDLLESSSDSMSRSIQLSIDSKPIKNRPNALLLLAILSMLPAGTSNDALERWAHILPQSGPAQVALLETALAQEGEDSIFILPVIRSFVLHPGHIADDVVRRARKCVQNACFSFLTKHKSPNPAHFKNNTQAISLEESNLQSILLDATNNSDGSAADPAALTEALLTLCWHQYHTRPRIKLIQHTLDLAQSHDNKAAIGEALNCYGRIYLRLDLYDDASEKLTMARDVFLALNDKFNAALCSLKLVRVYMYASLGEKRDKSLKDARAQVEDAKSPYLDAKYLLRHGETLWQSGLNSSAIEVLNQAKEEFSRLESPLDVARALFLLGRCYAGLRIYDNARSSLNDARHEYQRFGYDRPVAEVVHVLALTSEATGDYDGAFATAVHALGKYRLLGSPLGMGQILQFLGDIWLRRKEYEDARKAFQASLKNYESIPRRQDSAAACRAALLKIGKRAGLEVGAQPEQLDVGELADSDHFEELGISHPDSDSLDSALW